MSAPFAIVPGSPGGLAGFAWTDPSMAPGITSVQGRHLADLRTALNQAYQAPIHLNELGAALRGALRSGLDH